MKRKSIIIIDDRPLLRDAWSIVLESTNKYVVTGKFSKSKELTHLLRESKPDIVILDIGVKQLQDFPIIKIIRKFSPATKIIAISLQLDQVYTKRLLNAGAKGFIDKDCPAEELIEAVDTVLKGGTYVCNGLMPHTERNYSEFDEGRMRKLSKRELEIIQHVRRGLSSKEIAEKIAIAPRTVDTHRRNILRKLNLKNTTALMQFVHSHGLLVVPTIIIA